MPTPARSNTLRSMTGMVQYVTDLREKLESQLIEGQMIPELEAIFDRAERSLARSAGNFYSDLATKNGNIRQSVKNMQAGLNATERLRTDINKFIVRPGIKWGDKWAPISQQAGIDLAAANLEVRFMSQDQIDAAFRHLPRTATSGLFAGKERIHQIMGVVGDDVQKWFRSTVLDAITEGIPVQGPGDTLASRLIKSGRIRPLTIRTQKGGTITRSVVARANGIARVEMSRIMGDTQEAIAQDALGEDAMFINSNPRDSATTNICSEASREGPHPLDWWVESRFGRAPRFSPFHYCRSMLVGGREEWFDEDPVARPPVPTKVRRKRKAAAKKPKPPVPPVVPQTEAAARRLAIAQDSRADMGERLKNYDAGQAKVNAIGVLARESGVLKLRADIAASRARVKALETPLWKSSPDQPDYKRLKDRVLAERAEHTRLTGLLEQGEASLRTQADAILMNGGSTSRVVGSLPEKMTELSQFAKTRKAAEAWINGMLADAGWSGKDIRFRYEKIREGRPQATAPGVTRDGTLARVGTVELSAKGSVRTAVHELGHHLEYHRSDLTRQVRGTPGTAYRDYRVLKARHADDFPHVAEGQWPTPEELAAGRPQLKPRPRQLRSIPELKDYGYKARERGLRDDWVETMESFNKGYYTGKVYEDFSSEIISMGVEWMYTDPFTMAARDPEFFKFILAIFDGTIK